MESIKKTKTGMRLFVVGIIILLATWLMAVIIFLEIFEDTYFVGILALSVIILLVIGMTALVVGGSWAENRIYQLQIKEKYLLLILPSMVWGSMGGLLYISRNDPYLLGWSIVFLVLFTILSAKAFSE